MADDITSVSKHLRSKILFAEFKKLTMKPQYTQGERGDILEQTVVIKSCLVEETNPDRLSLAEKVLAASLSLLELEINIDAHKKTAQEVKKAGKKLAPGSTPPKPGEGGYA